VEAELAQQPEVAAAAVPEAERLPRDDHLGADRAEKVARELLRLELLQVVVERHDERLLDPVLGEQLQPPLERRQELDAVAARDARVGVEGHDRGHETGLDRGGDHALVTAMEAVEGADGDCARGPAELSRGPRDLHGSTVPFTATRSPPQRTRTRSSTRRRPWRMARAPCSSTSSAGRKASASAGGTIR